MDKNYSREELQTRKLNELKSIAKDLNLKSSGRKEELINRILQSQTTYFELLPKDITNIVEEYQIYNSKNNQFLLLLLNILKWSRIRGAKFRANPPPDKIKPYIDYIYQFATADLDKLNRFFEDNDIDVKFIPEDNQSKVSNFSTILIGKIPLIDDDLLADIFGALLESRLIGMDINTILYRENMFFGFVPLIYDHATIIMYGGGRKIIKL